MFGHFLLLGKFVLLYLNGHILNKPSVNLGGSPGLVVMLGDSSSEVFQFESQHRILDGHFSHWFVIKMHCLKRPKIDEKGPWMAHFVLKNIYPSGHTAQGFCMTRKPSCITSFFPTAMAFWNAAKVFQNWMNNFFRSYRWRVVGISRNWMHH